MVIAIIDFLFPKEFKEIIFKNKTVNLCYFTFINF